MKSGLVLFGLLLAASGNSSGGYSQSPRPAPNQQSVQVMGSNCQTQYGICPLVNPDGTPYQAPIGQPCTCGPDAGTVVQ
jgi:hypothetical protein